MASLQSAAPPYQSASVVLIMQRDFSLIRASAVVRRQSTRAPSRLR